MDAFKQIAVIVPSLHPDQKLLKLLDQLNQAGFCHIVVVDDGSGAEYAPYFEQAKHTYGATVLTHDINLGKGRALKFAFNHLLTTTDVFGAVTVDSDGQHALEDTIACANAVMEHPDKLIMGCRNFGKEQTGIPPRSRFGNVTTKNVLKVLCGVSLSDTQTGLRGFSRQLMRTFLRTKGERFEFEMNMIIDTKDQQIPLFEVPIQTIYIEDNATSHFNPLLDSARIYAVFGKFMLASVSSFLVDFLLFLLFVKLLKGQGLSPTSYIFTATVGARVLSACYNFFINKTAVFKSKAKNSKVLIKYFCLFLVQMLASALLVDTLFFATHASEMLLKVLVDSVLFVVSFWIQREIVFK